MGKMGAERVPDVIEQPIREICKNRLISLDLVLVPEEFPDGASEKLTAIGDLAGSDLDAEEVMRAACDLRVALGRVVRRLRQGYVVGELTLSESSVLARLDRDGPATPGSLAEGERVRPQAMGTTLSALVERGLVTRKPDAEDGRKVLVSVTEPGVRLLLDRRSHMTQRVATALAEAFSPADRQRLVEAIPLLERLADEL
jgi:DNA-binding MarR family transcriptional regulator